MRSKMFKVLLRASREVFFEILWNNERSLQRTWRQSKRMTI